MPTAFRLKTYPELYTSAMALAQILFDGIEIDQNVGSVIRNIVEIMTTLDAEQYVQMARLLDLGSLDQNRGDDLDEAGVAMGSDFFTALRRRPAQTSLAQISVSDGSVIARAALSADALAGTPVFSVAGGTEAVFGVAGAAILERATERSEEVVYTRLGTLFTVVSPSGGLRFNHALGGEVVRVAVKTTLAGDVAIGATGATLLAGTGAGWAASGSVVFERGTLREERLTFTRVSDVLVLGAATGFAHQTGTIVHQSTSGSDRAISAGALVYVPATESNKQINFRVTQGGVLLDGDFTSGLIEVESQEPGIDTRAGSGTITKWTSAPFAGAVVTNPIAATRGVDREKDDPYRQRLKDFRQTLSRGTALAVTSNVSGQLDPATNQRVVFAQIIEPVSPGVSLLYISDGTPTFAIDQLPFLGRDVLIADAELGDRRGKLSQRAPFAVSDSVPITPRLFRSVESGAATLVGADFLEDSALGMTINALAGMVLKTDDNQFFPIVSNTAIRFALTAAGATPSLGSYSVYNLAGSPLVPGVDYQFNATTGEVELTTALDPHDGLIAASDGASPSIGAYTYTIGLGAFVQRLVNGDSTAFDQFPGLRATGSQILVLAPTVISPTFIIKVVAAEGFSDLSLSGPVKDVVQSSINALGIGENIILSELVRLGKGVPGVKDFIILEPPGNLAVPSGQLARVGADNIEIV
jgi:uncharacterized phage protein gp47/JayE